MRAFNVPIGTPALASISNVNGIVGNSTYIGALALTMFTGYCTVIVVVFSRTLI
jgi:hypothetical protein